MRNVERSTLVAFYHQLSEIIDMQYHMKRKSAPENVVGRLGDGWV